MKEQIDMRAWMWEPGKKENGYIEVPGTDIQLPITLICGEKPGPTLLITGGIHSAEYVGIVAAMELGREILPEQLAGSLIVMPVVNRTGFEHRTMSMVFEDGKNLNRVFPGNPHGTAADKIAYFLSEEIQKRADYYVDLHCGDGYEILTPYVYCIGKGKTDVTAKSREMAQAVNVPWLVISDIASGGAYNHAGSMGIPSILIERGCLGCWSKEEVKKDKEDVLNILRFLGMMEGDAQSFEKNQDVMEKVYYPQAMETGCWYPEKNIGEIVGKGELLGTIRDYFGTNLDKIYAAEDGIILYQVMSLCVLKGGVTVAYGAVPAEKRME